MASRNANPSRSKVRTARAIDALEAAYSLEGTTEAWLGRILEAVGDDLDHGAGSYAFTARSADDPRLRPDSDLATRTLDPAYLGVLGRLNDAMPGELLDLLAGRFVSCGGVAHVLGRSSGVMQSFREIAGPFGFCDAFSLFAHDGDLGAIVVAAPSRRPVRPSAAAMQVWACLGVHFAAALRLRRKILAGSGEVLALLSPGGKVAHAEGIVRTDDDARARLRRAVRKVEQARTTAVRSEPERALALWQGLVDGRWSLVDRWESDGKRYIAVHANAPSVADPRALGGAERAVLAYAMRGASDKEIAFALGLPAGTTATLVRRVVRKLGCRRRVDLIGFDRAESFAVPEMELEVLRSGLDPKSPRLAQLTEGERALVMLVLGGATNTEIASERRRSRKTIENQLHRIYAKLGVQSRAELVEHMVDAPPRS